jgi:ribosomal protein S10
MGIRSPWDAVWNPTGLFDYSRKRANYSQWLITHARGIRIESQTKLAKEFEHVPMNAAVAVECTVKRLRLQ